MKKCIGKTATLWTAFRWVWPLQCLVHWMIQRVTLVIRIHSAWVLFLMAAPSKNITTTTRSKTAYARAVRKRPLIHFRTKETEPVWTASKAGLLRFGQWIVGKWAVLGRKRAWNRVRKPGVCEKDASHFHCTFSFERVTYVLEPCTQVQTADYINTHERVVPSHVVAEVSF